ncbi:unnamed protein product [Peronospora belbahrii]|nr:unnamed protein product [Peronospora belbahrii]
MKQASLCQYLPVFSSTTEGIETTAKLEQITCCCFIFEPTQKDFAASSSCDTDAFTSWGRTLRIRSAQTSVGVSTLVVTGTTSNTIYVHANEILLVSYVLSAQPAEIRSLCEDNSDHRHVLFVRCEDENRSFFILKFSSQGEHLSMELLLSFEHVGYAQIGYFSGTHVSDRSNQILLLNDVRGMFDIGDTMDIIGNEGGMHKFLDHKQLVKRSVLVVQKTLLPVIKLSCHRLRLHEVKKTKHGSRLCKRTRNNDSVSLDDTKAGTFCYIERIQKASSRDIIANHIEPVQDDAGGNGAASRAQLEKLANSFSARLSNGLQGLERLQIIVRDKVSLVYQLNQHIARLWQKIQASASYPNEHLVLLPFSAQEVDNRGMDFQVHVDMETIVCSTTDFRNDAEDETMMPARTSFSDDLKLKKQVLLEQLTLLEYVPSSSHVHAEVVLRNLSDFVFYDCYVFLTARNGRQTPAQGWRCLSSVVPEFCPARDMIKHTIRQQKESRFQLSFHFATSDPFLRERRPLEVMLWLHLRPSEDDSVFKTTLACNPSELALAIASVNIYLYDLIGISRGLRTPFRSNESGDLSTLQEQTQLLFISSGSNLVSWLRKIISELPTCTDFIIGRTLALISISVKSRVGVLYDINRIVASLPPDVHVMHNPFQHAYLRALQRVLCSMRQEILTIRHQGVHDTEKMDEMYGAGKNYKDRTQNAEDCDPASFYRMVQCNTDLYANRWLQKLQKRVDFQLIWIDAGTNDL